jgi:uncharacterized protein (TIGR03083 family)
VTTTTVGSAAVAAARRPALPRDVAMRLAATEYERFTEALRELTDEEWATPTANSGWTVRDMAGHVLGMTRMAASLPEQLRQMRAARRRGGLFIDALTAVQVEWTAGLSTAELVTAMAATGPKAARARRRMPGLLRRRQMPAEQPVAPEVFERWTFGFLADVILTRDPWMHRSDLAEATGRPMRLTPDHDGVLVADVAAEWAQRHGRPCTLTLAGPAGGSWTLGSGGESLELDAVEFCRILSGRPAGSGLLATRVPF